MPYVGAGEGGEAPLERDAAMAWRNCSDCCLHLSYMTSITRQNREYNYFSVLTLGLTLAAACLLRCSRMRCVAVVVDD